MPQDPREQFEQYEKERHELETQIKFLEDEVSLLRRRLSNAPRQVKLLEEKLVQTRADLSRALAQNEKLVSALKSERDKIEALKEEVEKLTQPPATFGVFLSMVEDEDSVADVFTAGRKMRVSVDPSLDRARLVKGVEVIRDEVELPFLYAELFLEHQLKPPKGVLLYGPPGCGKTLIAKAVAKSLAQQVAEKTGRSDAHSYFLNVKGPELLNKYVGETERQIRLIFQRAKEKSAEGFPVIVFFDEMDSLFRTRGSGISSDVENTIVPQLLSEIDGVEGLKNVIVIGASNREDMIDPAILRPGRLDVKIKIERPDGDAAREILSKYLTADVPLHGSEIEGAGGDRERSIRRMIDATVDRMYSTSEENRFLEVTYQSGDKEVLYFKDFNSGAMIENIVRRAKKVAIKRFLSQGEKGLQLEDLLAAIRDEFKENEDLPNTTNPDDWARISGKKGERIVYVRTLLGDAHGEGRQVERVTAGQYL